MKCAVPSNKDVHTCLKERMYDRSCLSLHLLIKCLKNVLIEFNKSLMIVDLCLGVVMIMVRVMVNRTANKYW